jgi:Homeodomain-like domain
MVTALPLRWLESRRAVWFARRRPLVTVGVEAADVERLLQAGGLVCPECCGVLVPWGRGRMRRLRGRGAERVEVRPRRGRCCGCARTHVLLPVSGLSRWADTVEVIGAALEAKASGQGHRKIAERLGRPVSTVRGWLRRFSSRAPEVAGVFTSLLVGLTDDPDGVLPMPAGSALADALVLAGGVEQLGDPGVREALLAQQPAEPGLPDPLAALAGFGQNPACRRQELLVGTARVVPLQHRRPTRAGECGAGLAELEGQPVLERGLPPPRPPPRVADPEHVAGRRATA